MSKEEYRQPSSLTESVKANKEEQRNKDKEQQYIDALAQFKSDAIKNVGNIEALINGSASNDMKKTVETMQNFLEKIKKMDDNQRGRNNTDSQLIAFTAVRNKGIPEQTRESEMGTLQYSKFGVLSGMVLPDNKTKLHIYREGGETNLDSRGKTESLELEYPDEKRVILFPEANQLIVKRNTRSYYKKLQKVETKVEPYLTIYDVRSGEILLDNITEKELYSGKYDKVIKNPETKKLLEKIMKEKSSRIAQQLRDAINEEQRNQKEQNDQFFQTNNAFEQKMKGATKINKTIVDYKDKRYEVQWGRGSNYYDFINLSNGQKVDQKSAVYLQLKNKLTKLQKEKDNKDDIFNSSFISSVSFGRSTNDTSSISSNRSTATGGSQESDSGNHSFVDGRKEAVHSTKNIKKLNSQQTRSFINNLKQNAATQVR